MTKRIELPGGVRIDPTIVPLTQGEEAVLQQLQQVVLGLNNITAQLDMLIRVEAQVIDKKVVQQKFKAFDERVKQAMADQVMEGQTTVDEAIDQAIKEGD